MTLNQRTRAIVEAARRALVAAKGSDHPVAESERLFALYCDELDPAWAPSGPGDEDERRWILDNVAEGRAPYASRPAGGKAVA